ncbi:45137_t:CDS:2, partial [Gigaspora margarita]
LVLHVFEDELYLNTTNEQELLEILVDRAYNPGYDYIAKHFYQYHDNVLGVTNLMARIHEKIPQVQEIYYMDTSASFDPLNISITLLYTSCAAGALPLELFLTSDKQEIMLEKA